MGNQENQNINTKDFVIGTLVGGIVGAAVALLYAPKSGRELRDNLNQGATDVRGRASDWKSVAYEKSSDWKDKAYVKGSEFKTKAVDSSKELSQKTQDLTKTLQSKIQERRNREDEALEAAEEVAEAIEEATEELEKK